MSSDDTAPQPSAEVEALLTKLMPQPPERHLLLCAGPECCSAVDGAATWDRLKAGTKALGLPLLRTKVLCLRVCCEGPWLVVYPEGTWYSHVTPERCDRILQEHIVEGRPVTEWIAKTAPLLARSAASN